MLNLFSLPETTTIQLEIRFQCSNRQQPNTATQLSILPANPDNENELWPEPNLGSTEISIG